jgi:hypothetical protein
MVGGRGRNTIKIRAGVHGGERTRFAAPVQNYKQLHEL